jgi:hypothetical protein
MALNLLWRRVDECNLHVRLGGLRSSRCPQAARFRALAEQKDFLTSGKDVDPDIAVLKEAKAAEYEKLK